MADAGADGAPDGAAGAGGAGGMNLPTGSCAMILEMDEPSWNGTPGEVRDSCHHNNGQAVGSLSIPTTVAEAHAGRSGAFQAGGCVAVPDAPELDPTTVLTMAAWIRPAAADGTLLSIFSKRFGYLMDSQYAMFLLDSNHLYVDIGSARFHGNASPVYGQWHHVAAVFDGTLSPGNSLSIYVDGALDMAFDAGPTIPAAVNVQPLHVGCLIENDQPDPFDESFIGDIDQAAIWTRALDSQAIQQLFQLTGSL
jgi:hypothetical protein